MYNCSRTSGILGCGGDAMSAMRLKKPGWVVCEVRGFTTG